MQHTKKRNSRRTKSLHSEQHDENEQDEEILDSQFNFLESKLKQTNTVKATIKRMNSFQEHIDIEQNMIIEKSKKESIFNFENDNVLNDSSESLINPIEKSTRCLSRSESIEHEELFDPSMIFVRIFQCYYWDSFDRIRKGKIFLTKTELLFKCSGMPFVRFRLDLSKIKAVYKIKNFKKQLETVLCLQLDYEKKIIFYKFRMPKSLVRNIILRLSIESRLLSSHSSNDHDENMNAYKQGIKRLGKNFIDTAQIFRKPSMTDLDQNNSNDINNKTVEITDNLDAEKNALNISLPEKEIFLSVDEKNNTTKPNQRMKNNSLRKIKENVRKTQSLTQHSISDPNSDREVKNNEDEKNSFKRYIKNRKINEIKKNITLKIQDLMEKIPDELKFEKNEKNNYYKNGSEEEERRSSKSCNSDSLNISNDSFDSFDKIENFKISSFSKNLNSIELPNDNLLELSKTSHIEIKPEELKKSTESNVRKQDLPLISTSEINNSILKKAKILNSSELIESNQRKLQLFYPFFAIFVAFIFLTAVNLSKLIFLEVQIENFAF